MGASTRPCTKQRQHETETRSNISHCMYCISSFARFIRCVSSRLVLCGALRCADVVWCGVLWCGAVWCDAVLVRFTHTCVPFLARCVSILSNSMAYLRDAVCTDSTVRSNVSWEDKPKPTDERGAGDKGM